jgi:phosphate transport system substrate-binding protein
MKFRQSFRVCDLPGVLQRRLKLKKFLSVMAGLALVLAAAGCPEAQPMTLNGAGATFPFPVYSQWAHKYAQITGIKVNYQGIGSGGGIAQIKAKTVDFGGTDETLPPEELDKSGLAQFPTLVGGVVPIVNLPGIESNQVKLDGPTLADIFLGKISKWDDPALKKLNPDVKLPATDITVAHRTDSSGTTWIFTHYLSDVSPEWKEKVGAGKAVKWPARHSIGGKGNAGVAGQVQTVSGAIGYVEYAYAYQNKIPTAMLKNKDGKFVKPDLETFQAAAAHADWKNAPRGFSVMLNNQPGADSWPIVGGTYILMHRNQADPDRGKAVLKFFEWALKNGADMAKELHYVPMPLSVVELVEAAWAQEIKADGKPLWP